MDSGAVGMGLNRLEGTRTDIRVGLWVLGQPRLGKKVWRIEVRGRNRAGIKDGMGGGHRVQGEVGVGG